MQIKENVKNLIFIVDGGLGKNIASTAVIKSLKKAYPNKNIIVVAGYIDIFSYNPNVKKVFNFHNPLYLYDDYMNDESQIVKVEPYLSHGYRNKTEHLIQAWCDQLGIENVQKTPELFFLENEFDAAKIYLDKLTDNGKKDFVLFQWIGGKIPKTNSKEELRSCLASMYRRNLPQEVAQEVHDKLVKQGFIVGTIQHENFPELQGMNRIFFPIRSVLALLKYAKGFIGIDSFLQHGAACSELGNKGVVCWGGTSPNCLGYEQHINLTKEVCSTPMCHRPNTYCFDTQPNGNLWDCPYGQKCTKSYTSDEIMKVFSQVVGKRAEIIEDIKNTKKQKETKQCKSCNK